MNDLPRDRPLIEVLETAGMLALGRSVELPVKPSAGVVSEADQDRTLLLHLSCSSFYI